MTQVLDGSLSVVNIECPDGFHSIHPRRLWYGIVESRDGEQWYIHAWDEDAKDYIEFALCDILRWDVGAIFERNGET